MIYILKDYKGRIVAILGASSEQHVNAYTQGKDIEYHSCTAIDPSVINDNEKVGYITPILIANKVKGYNLDTSKEYLVIE